MASAQLMMGGRSSYSTFTSRTAARAWASVSATITPMACPTHVTSPSANRCSSCSTAPTRLSPGTSLAPKNASTPSALRASEVSTDSSLACGRALGTTAAYSVLAGSGMSSTYVASPVTCISAATWRYGLPTTSLSPTPSKYCSPRAAGRSYSTSADSASSGKADVKSGTSAARELLTDTRKRNRKLAASDLLNSTMPPGASAVMLTSCCSFSRAADSAFWSHVTPVRACSVSGAFMVLAATPPKANSTSSPTQAPVESWTILTRMPPFAMAMSSSFR
mmetsp:Transcript_14929/g.45058  ORF Transcript_14929/g.45058 Transcript_14929/m.45058 type:complete len:278 (-) Transcript_14929:1730-2563(-)